MGIYTHPSAAFDRFCSDRRLPSGSLVRWYFSEYCLFVHHQGPEYLTYSLIENAWVTFAQSLLSAAHTVRTGERKHAAL